MQTSLLWKVDLKCPEVGTIVHTRDELGIVVCYLTYARILDVCTGDTTFDFSGFGELSPASAITPDASLAVTASCFDNFLTVYDVRNNKVLHHLVGHTRGVNSVAITPDGTKAITGSDDRTVRVWDLVTGVELLCLRGHTKQVMAVAVTPDGQRVVTGSWDDTARVWDMDTGMELLKLEGHTNSVNSVAVTPDGKRVVTAGSWDKTARVWDMETGVELLLLEGHTAHIVHVTIYDNMVITCSYDRTLRIWDLKKGKQLHCRHFPAIITKLTISADGTKFFGSCADGFLYAWRMTMAEDAVVALCWGYPGEAVVWGVGKFLPHC